MKPRGPFRASRNRPHDRRTAARLSRVVPLALLLLSSAAAGALEWQPTAGPYGGVIHAFYTALDGSVLTGTDSGEVYRTTSTGDSWELVTADLPAKSVLSFIEKDGRLYVGTDGNGVWRSADNGATWENLDRTTLVNPTVRSMAVLEGVLYAGTSGGVSRFDEGGDYPDTWSTLIGELLMVEGSLHAATHGGVYLFDANTRRWSEQNVGLARGSGASRMVRSLAHCDGKLVAGTAAAGIFVSDDLGQSWRPASVGLEAPAPDTIPVNVLDIVHSTRGLIASVAAQGLYISTDGAATWAPYADGLPNPYTNVLHEEDGVVLAGTYGTGVFRLLPGSDTWTYSSEGIRDTSVFALASDASNLYMGGSGGMFISEDGGDSWRPSNTGLATLNIRAITIIDGVVYAGTYRDGYYMSGDQGATWSRVEGTLFSRLTVRMFVRSGGRYYAATAGQGVLVADNGRGPWAPTNDGLALPYVVWLAAAGDTLYAGTDGKGLFASVDGGASWSEVGSGLGKPFVFATATLGSRLFVATYGSGVYELVGDLWESRSVGITDLNVRSLVAVGDTLYAGTKEAGVFESTDAGLSWREANDGWTERRVRTLLVVGDELYAGTARGGVYKAALR